MSYLLLKAEVICKNPIMAGILASINDDEIIALY